MKETVDAAIIGAGPYGLSLAAHLDASQVSFRIFGTPMHTWLTQMPKGMHLKSEGFASNLSAPYEGYTLRQFCERRSIPYEDTGLPVALDTFAAYGQDFQRRMVPNLEDRTVLSVERSADGFELRLDNGESVRATKVVVAAGISHFRYLPPVLRGLPAGLVTHSSEHVSLDPLRAKDVTILGAGASAMTLAALLHEAGATVHVIARAPAVHFHAPPGLKPRTVTDELRAPMTGLGPGWRSLLCVKAPLVFHNLPAALRLKIVRKHLGPAAGWFTREAVLRGVELQVNASLEDVQVSNDRLCLRIKRPDGSRIIETDHLIAATGFRVDIKKLPFLSAGLQSAIHAEGNFPALSNSFESTVPGLYFIGPAAAGSFGPMLRFAYGAKFSARRLSRHLAGSDRLRKINLQFVARSENA